MLANQGSGFQSEIEMFPFGIFSDITNLRLRKNYVLSCVRIFVETWFEMFMSIQQFQSLPFTTRVCSFRRKHDNDYRCHCNCDLYMAAAKTHVKILITSAFNFQLVQTMNAT